MGLFKKITTSFMAMLLFVNSAWSMPTGKEVYRNDDMGVVVYTDSVDTGVFWYLPMVQLDQKDGKVNYRSRKRADGNVDLTFYVLPHFTKEMSEFVSREIPGLHNRNQLKPVQAKRFGFQSKEFNLLAMSDEVTDRQYINRPQMIRMTLTPDQNEDFMDLFTSSPGVPVNMVIYYEAEKMEKFLNIELSYKDVYDAMNIGATGKYKFTKAEISVNMEKFIVNRYLHVRRKGDLKMPEIVERVISECFTSTKSKDGNQRFNVMGPTVFGVAPKTSKTGKKGAQSNREQEQELAEMKRLEAELAGLDPVVGVVPGAGPLIVTTDPRRTTTVAVAEDTPVPPPPPLPPVRGRPPGPVVPPYTPYTPPAPANNNPGTTSDGLTFTFKKELSTREEKFFFMEEVVADTQEIVVIPTFLTERPQATPTKIVNTLGQKKIRIAHDNDKARLARSGVYVQAGDQWTINAAFSMSATSVFRGTETVYPWDSKWSSPDGDLYFRVGDGPWRKVNGRALIGGDSLQEGELQFHLDKSSIWNKLPAKYRESKWHKSAIFAYDYFYPEFLVTLTGKRVEMKTW